MYLSPPQQLEFYAKQLGDKEPYILCEYAHSIGNSTGNLHKYTELFDQYPCLQGGFIWDWKDQALRHQTEDGIEFLAYGGGDFGDSPNDGKFSGDGIIFADGTITPKLIEVKTCYRNIEFEQLNLATGEVKIINKFLFQSLKDFKLIWTVEEEGEVLESGVQLLDAAPGISTINHIAISNSFYKFTKRKSD
ncbi:beta-galactosidase [Gracilibacillus boraciitolerans JCM 21714]|uniref:beta-galactosidase n=1 Tax=Gracilibacillus boraciitolerans JCM 21714 TaxID=1298598 RepID=W4VQV7_9BACI|nr:beta-galactosidase [Gracilibacillus boraciitolerans JCM 21714]